MPRRLLSIVEPGPPGFRTCSRLEAKDVRRDPFALYAESAQQALAALGEHAGRVPGLVFTPGAGLEWRKLKGQLIHVVVPRALECSLQELAPMWLDLLTTVRDEEDRAALARRSLTRSREDRARLQQEFASFRESLMREMAEREVAQRALQESESRFRTIFDSVHDAIFLHDIDTGVLIDVNARTCELYEASREEIIGSDVGRLSLGDHSFNSDLARDKIHQAADGVPQLFTWRARSLKGRLFWIEVALKRASVNGVDRVLAVGRDITDRIDAEARHRELERQMLHAQKLESLGVLAGGIAHDFNNILAAILGNADLALLRLPPELQARCYLQEISTASRRAADLCRQMLAYAGRGQFLVERIDLSATVRDMADMLRVSISKKATLDCNLANDLPPIEADVSQIRQIVMNLIVNASEALGERPGTIRLSTGLCAGTSGDPDALVETSGELSGSCVFLEVADDGAGMDEVTRRRVLEPFFSTKFAGRGLGLAAVQGIVRAHHGAIELRSAPGEGSTFRIVLPALPLPTLQASCEPAPVSERWHARGTVLVIDDDPLVQRVTCQMLGAPGFQVQCASDGRAGIDFFRERMDASGDDAIVCVVLDWMMPVMDGEQTLRELRRLRPSLPILITTGGAIDTHDAEGTHPGVTDSLQKPFGAEELLEKVRRLVLRP